MLDDSKLAERPPLEYWDFDPFLARSYQSYLQEYNLSQQVQSVQTCVALLFELNISPQMLLPHET